VQISNFDGKKLDVGKDPKSRSSEIEKLKYIDNEV
jgi:hypothetical protein